MYFLLTLTILIVTGTASCPNPPPAAQFTIEKYEGLWYEIAKYQTAGGAFFERDCKCTKIDVFRASGEIKAYQSCEKNGKISAVNATLIPTDIPGKFTEKISLNKVGYWVIQLDNQSAIEFDCSETSGIRNYCIHIMSKQKTISQEKLKALSDYALSLGLNPNNLPMTITDQVNCVYSQKNLLEN